MTYLAKKLSKMLCELGVTKEELNLVIHRTRAGRHQKATGAWIWEAFVLEEQENKKAWSVCGSADRLKDVVNAHFKSAAHYISIDKPYFLGPNDGVELTVEKKNAQDKEN